MITLGVLAVLAVPCLLIGGGTALFWKSQRPRIAKWSAIAYAVLALTVLFGVGPYLAAWSIVNAGTRPPDRSLKDTPGTYQVQYEDVTFNARDSVRLSGWFIPPSGKSAIIICSHGLFRNRVEVLARTIPLVRAGYGALIYDSRSHGESDKSIVSLGYYERHDVLGANQYIVHRYQDALEQPKIVLFGVSMGAVATLEAAGESSQYSAIILDSPFSSLRETVVDHSWLLFKLPRYTLPTLFVFWFQRLAGFDVDRVDSHKTLQRTQPVPLLIISSEGDRRIGPEVARALYRESKSGHKRIEIFGKDVSHGAAARLHLDDYTRLVLSFLNEALSDSTNAVDITPPSAGASYRK